MRKKDYLCKEECDCLKGIFAVFVLMSHLFGAVSSYFVTSPFRHVFQAMGYLSVSVFFFLSGYGLSLQYSRRGKAYLTQFPKRRLLPYAIVYLFTLLIYLFFRVIVLGEAFRFPLFILSFLLSNTYISNGWYLQTLFLFYLFFLAAYFSFKKRKHKYAFLFLLVVLYCIICFFCKAPTHLYKSSLAFPLGFSYYDEQEKIDRFLENGRRELICSIGLFFSFCACFIVGSLPIFPIVARLFEMGSAVFFVLFVLTLVRHVRINWFFTRWLGKYYLEIYVMQGMAISLFQSRLIFLENPILLVLAACVVLGILVLLTHPIYGYINQKLFRRSK